MKTSKKLLVLSAGILIALFVTSMAVLRQDVQALMTQSEYQTRFKEVPVDSFDELDFSGKWMVKIRPGRVYKVEVEEGALWSTLESIDGTLYFKSDTTSAERIHVKISAPTLKGIEAAGGTKIQMDNFLADSLTVILKDAAFQGNKNRLKYSSFWTTGDSRLEIADPDI